MVNLNEAKDRTKRWSSGTNVYWPDMGWWMIKRAKTGKPKIRTLNKWEKEYFKELNKKNKYGYNKTDEDYSIW